MWNYKKIAGIVLTICLLFFNVSVYSAYVKNGYSFSNPKNIVYEVSSTIGQYGGILCTYTEKWEGEYGETELVFNYGTEDNIYLYGNLSYDNGKYAVTYHTSDDHHSITFYKSFLNATELQKKEVIVHEVGHTLGLAHCQTSRESYSVMRTLGFNGKPYPLEDDIDGIIDIYGGE